MKWLTRDQWRDRFAKVYEEHLVPTCDQTDLDADEIMAILGHDWFMSTVWGCAFEDFLTREFEDGSNIVDDYLKRRGWKEGASTRSYMAALRASVVSLYEVSDIVRDTSFRARDLVRGGEPVPISERSATRSLKQWDRIATRVVQVGSRTHISGAILPFERDASEELLKLLRKLAKRAEKEKQKFANLVGSGVDNPAIVSGFSDAAVLRAVTPTITTLWLIDALDSALSPLIPEVRNTEGDEILFCTAHYPLAAGTSGDDIRSALGRCLELRQENATFWNWIGSRKPAKASGKSRAPKAQTFMTTLDDGSLVLGGVELTEKAVVLSVILARVPIGARRYCPRRSADWWDSLWSSCSRSSSSRQRRAARRPRYWISLSKSASPLFATVWIGTIATSSISRSRRSEISHHARWLEFRKVEVKVADWLKTLENRSAGAKGSNDAIANYSFGWLWTELGVEELRR